MPVLSVSVVVCTYNPSYEKLRLTLKSIMLQKDINYEIIISDDGSKCNYFDEIITFFKDSDFTAYKLISKEKNEGTVKNVIAGVSASSGEYIKLISPGDCLYGATTLSDWVKVARQNSAAVVFADSVYFCIDDNKINLLQARAYPQKIKIYNSGGERLRKNYLLHNDLCIGAATVVLKQKLEEYLDIIEDKVIYAEDQAYRLMAHKNEKMVWFNDYPVLYEYGTGISTKGSELWDKRIKADYLATNNIILGWLSHTSNFDKKLYRFIKYVENPTINNRISLSLAAPELVFNKLCNRLGKIFRILDVRMSPLIYKDMFIRDLLE